MLINGKMAVVIGGARGLGKDFVKQLLENGAKVRTYRTFSSTITCYAIKLYQYLCIYSVYICVPYHAC